MKLKTHKSELKLNKTEKSEVKTTARKQFVKNTIKDGIKKTDDPMEKEMVQGLMVAGYVTSKGARIGVKAVKQGKKTFLTVQKIMMQGIQERNFFLDYRKQSRKDLQKKS